MVDPAGDLRLAGFDLVGQFPLEPRPQVAVADEPERDARREPLGGGCQRPDALLLVQPADEPDGLLALLVRRRRVEPVGVDVPRAPRIHVGGLGIDAELPRH